MKNKGITLIALVITIIVLLILVGISIATLTGENGIITQADKAREETEKANAKEQAQLEIANWKADKLQKGENSGLNDSIVKGIITGKDFVGTVGETSFTTKKSGYEIQYSELYKSNAYKYTDKNKKVATIPEGFKVSEKEEEQIIDTGLVVIGPDGSEFVWIPVETAVAKSEEEGTTNKAMAVNLGTESEPQYRGLLYDFTSTGSTVLSGCTTTETSYREPDIASTYDNNIGYLNIINNILGTNLSTKEQFKEQMQEEYNEMIESVKKYGGFYIARYEASESNGKVESKANSIALNEINWYGLYAKCKTYDASSVKSTMVWGSQWDAMMNWMVKNNINVDTTTVPNGGTKNTNETITGVEGSTDILNNVYDLYGGRSEWTLEAISTESRSIRGGYYGYSYTPSFLESPGPTFISASYTSRPTLYIM